MAIESVQLSEFFESVKKPRYVLGTTYTLSLAFFESVVMPCITRSHLHKCLIICDDIGYHRALTEGAALQGTGQDYLVAPAPVPGCFHPKVWLIVGDTEAALLAGSGNLTQSGFTVNAELFDSLHFSTEQPPTEALLNDITTFIDGLTDMWKSDDADRLLCVEVLKQIRHELTTLFPAPAEEDSSSRLIHSFSGTLIDGLPEVPDCSEFYAAAPFFGGKISGLALLKSRYPESKIHVFPAIHDKDATDIPLEQTRTQISPATLSPLKVPGKVRPLAHLKLYGIQSPSESWLYCTSANCTAAAWEGPNIEAGLLRKVDASLLAEYFQPDQGTLPDKSITDNDTANTSPHNFRLTAVDIGTGLDVTIAESEHNRLPLSDIRITLRSGSHLVSHETDSFFENKKTQHIIWGAFGDWQRPKNMALCLELTACDSAGNAVSGACFVENRRLLTADPTHRSAWRGALALLDPEAMPDLSDIAAIFTLADNIFAGRIVSKTASVHNHDKRTPEDDGEESEIHVAIWPPQPIHHDLQKQIGTSGQGQLHWCQTILQTFLKPDPVGNSERESSVQDLDDDGNEDTPEKTEAAIEKELKQMQTAADRMWSKAEKDYERLSIRLWELEPTEKQAKNLWIGSIVVFLATMAVRRTASRLASSMGQIPLAGDLADDFLRLMTSPREQEPGSWSPQNKRYRGEIFPPLSKDLRENCNAAIDPDLSCIMLAIVTQKMMKDGFQTEHTLPWQRLLREVMDSSFEPSESEFESSLHAWRRYLFDDGNRYTDHEFTSTLQTLISMRDA